MAGSALNGKTFISGRAINKKTLTFTRDTTDTTDWTGAGIECLLTPATGTAIALSVGAGITKATDTASSQVAELEVTEAQVSALLAGETSMVVTYNIWIKESGAEASSGHEGTAYHGSFTIKAEGS
jgi:hypothetical protein